MYWNDTIKLSRFNYSILKANLQKQQFIIISKMGSKLSSGVISYIGETLPETRDTLYLLLA
jgi:hypothetical protein